MRTKTLTASTRRPPCRRFSPLEHAAFALSFHLAEHARITAAPWQMFVDRRAWYVLTPAEYRAGPLAHVRHCLNGWLAYVADELAPAAGGVAALPDEVQRLLDQADAIATTPAASPPAA